MCKKFLFLVSFVLVLGLVLTSATKADLIGWWKLDDATGTTAVDSSGYDNHGTLEGNPQWVDGVIGGALELDGDDDFVAIDSIADDLTENNFTVTAWIQTTMGGDGNVIGANDTGSGHDFIFGVSGSGTLLVEADSLNEYPPVINDGVWHHIAYVRDGSTAYAYTDGELVGTETPSGDPAGQARWSIGQEWDSSPSDEYQGIVDDVHFYNHPLTEGEIKGVMIGSGYPYASRPEPEDGAIIAETWASLTWTPGAFAVSHDVYLGENFDDVNDGTGDTLMGNQAVNFFTVGFPGFPYPDGLVPGTTYYWRIDEVNEVDPNSPWKGDVWSFSIPSTKAHAPTPPDGAKYVATDATLSWTAGFDTKLHTVYFGDDFDTVSNATGGLPQSVTTFDPGPLAKNKTYYWRVDEFDGVTTYTGDVWSFSTVIDIAITDPDMIGWWKFDEGSGTKVIDFSGYGNDGAIGGSRAQWVEGIAGYALNLPGGSYVAIDGVVDDISSTNISLSAWIKTTQVGEGNVFASNDSDSGHPFMFGVTNGNPFVNDGGDTEFPPAVNDDQWHMITYVRDGSRGTIYVDGAQQGTYTPTFSLSSVTRWSIGQEWDGTSPSDFYVGIVDDARFYNKSLTPDEVVELTRGDPLLAWNPKPVNGATIDVEAAKQPLSWSAGDEAAQHDVYLGLDRTAVENADSSDTTGIYRGQQAGTTYTPPEGLEWGTGPYYWRVDELNNDGTLTTGAIWSFTVADHLIVEDFESYTDDDQAGEAIWQSWIDGFGVADNGAQVGYLLPPYAEQGIVHGGGQSMPLFYDNTAGVDNSEAELVLTSPRDWTAHDVSELSVWFRGYPGSVGSFVEAPAGTYTMQATGTDIWDTADEFHFAYKMLNGAGSITAKVLSIDNTDPWAKAGVMIRETLDPGSRHAFACLTPGSGVASQARVDTDNTSISTNQTGLTAPYWIKLERDVAGNFTVTHSANGTTWSPVQGAIPNRVMMSANVYIGLALTAHNANAVCEAKFSDVTMTGNVSGQWAHQDIGIASNAAEPLYVAVSNASGSPAIVANDDPAAATLDTWTEWVIPLQAFADQGINLTDVDKIAIGLGAKGNPAAAGGSGTMFFDDIGLYRSRDGQ